MVLYLEHNHMLHIKIVGGKQNKQIVLNFALWQSYQYSEDEKLQQMAHKRLDITKFGSQRNQGKNQSNFTDQGPKVN